MPSIGKLALVPVLVGLSAFGFNATMLALGGNGLGKILNDVAGTGDIAVDMAGAPTPFKRVYTGVEALDTQLSVLVAFWASMLDDPGAKPEIWAFYIWSMAQFAAGWTVILLEGRRAGNRGRLVSWVGTVGLVFQALTYTFAVPLYLALHLLTSPSAKLGGLNRKSAGEAARQNLFVYLWDLALIPMSVTLSFVVPAVFMSMPWIFEQTTATHYNWVAFWQVFPVWSVIILSILHNAFYYLLGSLTPRDAQDKPTTPGNGYMTAVAGVYQFSITLGAVTQLPVVILSLLPAHLRASLAAVFPKYAFVFTDVTFARTFIPFPLGGSPVVDPTNYGPGELSPITMNFLQYDLYTGSTALLLWTLYVYSTTPGRSFSAGLPKAVFWTLIGGPSAASAALLWDRDEIVKEGESEKTK
ncbi:hypothetical protein M426DRAFT_182430 [Hypoxylon sp. CI-4A]|nr:hypothetical protein M426DRAFT_182430 [Hypoxylon sp. CI-4A]